MTLTQDDLQAIKGIVVDVVDRAIEESDQRTAAGFAEVHEKVDALDQKIDAVGARLSDEIKTVDYKVDQAFDTIKDVADKVTANAKQTSENASFISKMKTVLR